MVEVADMYYTRLYLVQDFSETLVNSGRLVSILETGIVYNVHRNPVVFGIVFHP